MNNEFELEGSATHLMWMRYNIHDKKQILDEKFDNGRWGITGEGAGVTPNDGFKTNYLWVVCLFV